MESTGGEARRKQLVRQLATSIDIEGNTELELWIPRSILDLGLFLICRLI